MEYADATGNDQYYTYAKSQMDYLLGDNPQGRSYLIGYSDTYPVNIHHRAANPTKTSATYTLYGALVGGPTDANGSYNDSTDAYSCTEPALDYNGNFIMAIAGLYNRYSLGTGTDQLDSIVSNASEINEDYVFGAWYEGGNVVVDPIPEETTTTEEEVTTTPADYVDYYEGTVTAIDGIAVTIEYEGTTRTFNTSIQDVSLEGISVGDTVSLSVVNGGTLASLELVKKAETTTVTTEETTTTTEATTTEPTTTSETTTEPTTTTTEDTTTTVVSDVRLGDVNGDGTVDGRDLILLKKSVLGLVDDSAINLANANVNGDSTVDGRDLILLKKVVLGLATLD
jgi:hypothetical protein